MTGIVVSARAVVCHEENTLLLVRTQEGCWHLPGGLLEVGETLDQCAIRETREETGFSVKVDALFCCYEFYDSRYDNHRVEHCFFASVISPPPPGKWRDQGEDQSVTDARFFTLEEIKTLADAYPSLLKDGLWQQRQGRGYLGVIPAGQTPAFRLHLPK